MSAGAGFGFGGLRPIPGLKVPLLGYIRGYHFHSKHESINRRTVLPRFA